MANPILLWESKPRSDELNAFRCQAMMDFCNTARLRGDAFRLGQRLCSLPLSRASRWSLDLFGGRVGCQDDAAGRRGGHAAARRRRPREAPLQTSQPLEPGRVPGAGGRRGAVQRLQARAHPAATLRCRSLAHTVLAWVGGSSLALCVRDCCRDVFFKPTGRQLFICPLTWRIRVPGWRAC